MTFNVKDFPRRIVSAHGIDVMRPDSFALELLARDPEAVQAAARTHRAELRNPPYSVAGYLDSLSRVGLRRTAEQLRKAGYDL